MLMESKPELYIDSLKVRRRNTYIEYEKYNSGRLLLTLSESNTVLTKIKPEVQKILICSKSREGTAQSSGATRFSNTSVEVHQIFVINARNRKLLQANMKIKIIHLEILGNMCITIVC